MNKQTGVIGGIIIIAIIAAFIYITYGSSGLLGNNATSTVSTSTDVTGGVTGGGTNTGTGTGAIPGAPTAATNATVAPTDTTVVITGTVNPDGAITSYWYEFGTTPSLGKKTSTQTVGSGFTAIPTPGYITGLTKSTTYYFRLVAQNAYGKSTGVQHSFTTTNGTPAPVGSVPAARTLAVSGQTATNAALIGTVNPNKASTQYWFEYGTSASLGNTTPFVSVGNGSVSVDASASVSNLSAGTTYYYRLNAQNQFGTVNGSILTFKTSGTPASTTAAPVVTTQVPGPVATTTATLNGTVNPGGAQTRYWFEYSTDTLLGSALLKTTPQKSAGAGRTTVSAQATVTGLRSGTTYYVRLVAENAEGTVRGDKQTFTTK
ncbi:MAG: fibronectin type III domain-containing protein [Candidatus Paceibacterota bacterium]